MVHFCEQCELKMVCEKAFATHVSADFVKAPEVRFDYQNYLVGLDMSADAIIDWIVVKIRDFPGRYKDENGKLVPTPSFLPILNPGARFWFQDQIADGGWQSLDDVPRLRSEAVGRWRLIGVARDTAETVQPIC